MISYHYVWTLIIVCFLKTYFIIIFHAWPVKTWGKLMYLICVPFFAIFVFPLLILVLNLS